MSRQASEPPRGSLLAVWLIAAVASVGLLAVIAYFRGPVDLYPIPATTRAGIFNLDALPGPAPPVTPQVPEPDRPAVVFVGQPDRLLASAPRCLKPSRRIWRTS
jgi:hypothetical protein